MEKYRQKTTLASFMDHLLRLLIAALAGIAWFVALWGLSLPALTAGLALGGLLWLCVRSFGKKRVLKREAAMRRLLGGELALEKLLLLPPRHAAFQVALWLTPKAPVEMQRAVDWGVVGNLRGKRVLIRLIAQHKSMEVNPQQVVEVVKEAKAHESQRCFLCLTAPISREAAAYAESVDLEIRLVKRDELIALAGACTPASDEDLLALKRRRPKRRTLREWGQMIFHPSRTKRYFWYGAGLSALAFFTGQSFYPLPAIFCLLLFLGCKVYERKAGEAQW